MRALEPSEKKKERAEDMSMSVIITASNQNTGGDKAGRVRPQRRLRPSEKRKGKKRGKYYRADCWVQLNAESSDSESTRYGLSGAAEDLSHVLVAWLPGDTQRRFEIRTFLSIVPLNFTATRKLESFLISVSIAIAKTILHEFFILYLGQGQIEAEKSTG